MTQPRPARILVIDGDARESAAIRAELRNAGYDVVLCCDSLDGLIAVEDEHPSLVVLDWTMPFIEGWVFIEAMRAALPSPPPIVAIIAAGNNPDDAVRSGVQAVVLRPVALTDFVRSIRRALGEPSP